MMAKVEVRYNYRLRVHAREARLLQGVFDSCRFVWNQALGRWGDLWRHEGLSYSYGTAAAELTDWRSRFEWLADQPQCPQQQALRHLYRSISAFLDRANPAGRPKYTRPSPGHGRGNISPRDRLALDPNPGPFLKESSIDETWPVL